MGCHLPAPPPAPRAGDLSDVLRLDLKPGTAGAGVPPGASGQFLAFKEFESGGALDSALALVEHLMSNE